MMKIEIGLKINRYQIVKPLGEGGMAVVYKAHDERLDVDIAIKFIRVENLAPRILESTLKRFEREAKSLARLDHPNIVKVTDYGEFEGVPYLVMPFYSGGTLRDNHNRYHMNWRESVHLILPIARALAYAHRSGLIHRDVKPANILISESGNPMLSDFGIAKIMEVDAASTLTGAGMGIGTPEYMAPEQWTGKAAYYSDIYSLGVTLYELVAGRKPFVADTPAAIFVKQAKEPVPSPASFNADVPKKLENILKKALEKSPQDRYENMEDFAAALQGLLAEESETAAVVISDDSTIISSPATKTFVTPKTATVQKKTEVQKPPAPVKKVESQQPEKIASKKRSTSIWAGLAIALIAASLCTCAGIFLLQAYAPAVPVANTATRAPSSTAVAATKTVKSQPSATMEVETPLPPTSQSTLEPSATQAECDSASISFRSTAKGRFLEICSPQSGKYEVGPIAEGDYAIGPNELFFVYCDVNGIVYASRFGDRTLTTMEDNLKDFAIIRAKSETPSYTMTFTLDSTYRVLIEETHSGEKRAINIPRYISNP